MRLSGKGKDLWIAIGVASLELFAFAIHDADIVSYSGMHTCNFCNARLTGEVERSHN